MTKILPQKKQKILIYLKHFIQKYGYAPTLRQVQKHFKLSSPATAHEHLEYLESHGYIHRDEHSLCILNGNTINNSTFQDTFLEDEVITLPVVGLITAGEPIEAIEDKSETLAVPQKLLKRKDAYVLKVKGDSMIESCIDDGDYVIVQKQDFANNGDIVVALLEDGTATLKEFHKEKHYVRLQPRNAKYQPLRVTNVVIQGKVAGIIRAFN